MPQFGETEVGWALRPEAWGHGYPTDAARAWVHCGFLKFGLEYLIAMIPPDNTRSLRVAELLGMTPLREAVVYDTSVIVHAVDRPTWTARLPSV